MANRIPTYAGLSFDDLNSLSIEQLWSLPLGIGHLGDNAVTYFKFFGKFIRAHIIAREQVLALQKLVVGTLNQVRTADASFYDDLTTSIVPYQQDMTKAIAGAEAVQDYAKRACVNLLTKAIAADLGLPAGTDLDTVGPAFTDAIAEMGLSAAPAVEGVVGFTAYFRDVLGITLPTSDAPNLPDSWIDAELV